MKGRVLLIEDDEDLARGLVFNLRHEGYDARSAGTFEEGRAAAVRGDVDLVLLDLALPDGDGLDILREVRARGSAIPVICLTARGQETDVVMGLGVGADDYVTKPFGLAELLARVEALLRRSGRVSESLIRLGDVEVDLKAQRIVREGTTRDLTRIEAELLQYLFARRGQAVPREDLLRDLWGVSSRHDTRTLDNHVARLRRKIEADPARPALLVTVHGTGYRLDVETP